MLDPKSGTWQLAQQCKRAMIHQVALWPSEKGGPLADVVLRSMGVKNVERDGLGPRILTDLLIHGIFCFGNQAMFQRSLVH